MLQVRTNVQVELQAIAAQRPHAGGQVWRRTISDGDINSIYPRIIELFWIADSLH